MISEFKTQCLAPQKGGQSPPVGRNRAVGRTSGSGGAWATPPVPGRRPTARDDTHPGRWAAVARWVTVRPLPIAPPFPSFPAPRPSSPGRMTSWNGSDEVNRKPDEPNHPSEWDPKARPTPDPPLMRGPSPFPNRRLSPVPGETEFSFLRSHDFYGNFVPSPFACVCPPHVPNPHPARGPHFPANQDKFGHREGGGVIAITSWGTE